MVAEGFVQLRCAAALLQENDGLPPYFAGGEKFASGKCARHAMDDAGV